MKNRLIRNYVTTGLGCALIVYCMVAQYNGQVWTELAGFYGMAGMLLRSKDSLIGLDKD